MDSTDEFKKVGIKNHTCYCFNDIIKIEDFIINDILIDEKYFILYHFIQKFDC